MKPIGDDGDTESMKNRLSKRSRKSSPDLTSDDSQSAKVTKTNDIDVSTEAQNNRWERQRQKSKQQLLAEQQRVEQRVQQEQTKLKQQEMLLQQQQRQKSEARANSEEISILRTNPNISMRELFPGEDELGLNVNIPFTTGSWRTPDGWSKVTSTVQYDEPTRRLWEELQKPYGNQSSFLRHLILLEKYFRNGDLVLASSANLNAVTYAESVQQRLQSYDNIPPRPICISQIVNASNSDASTTPIIDLSQIPAAKSFNVPNAAVTITKAPSTKPTTDSTSTSLLKTNATASTSSTASRGKYSMTTEPISTNENGKQTANKSVEAMKLNSTINGTPKNKTTASLPPELICINTSTPNEKTQQMLSQQLYQQQMQLTLQQHLQQQHQNSLLLTQQQKAQIQSTSNSPKKSSSVTAMPSAVAAAAAAVASTSNACAPTARTPSIIRLPDSLTEIERRESKHWRPTLMPVTTVKNSSEVLYQTADGRKLPNLVQVQSGGKPYMISIHDYNRMCIVRRERLLKEQEQMMKTKSSSSSSHQTSPNHNATKTSQLANSVTVAHENGPNAINNFTKKVQIPNKILEQNSLIPINAKPLIDNSQNDSLLKVRKNQSSLLKANAINQQPLPKLSVPVPIPPNASVTATVVAPSTAKLPLSLTSALSQSNVVSITSTPSISAILSMNSDTPSSTPPPIQIIPQSLAIGVNSTMPINTVNNVSALDALLKTTNQVITTPTSMWQWAESLNKSNNGVTATPIDQSTKSILSKIPKSLTVIPQQKRLSSRGCDEN